MIGMIRNVLIACEESQRVCAAFREKGFNAYSCDILEPSGGHPEWHIRGDVRELLDPPIKICSFDEDIDDEPLSTFQTMDGKRHALPNWDLLIAFPPHTYLSAAGACRMYPHKGQIDPVRLAKAEEAKRFFLTLLNADIPHVAVENPRPLKIVGLPEPTQTIQPYQFGEPYSKRTCLWLRNLPPLNPTKILSEYKPFVSCGTSRNKGNKDKAGCSRAGGAQIARSKTFIGIAKAMADQWEKVFVNTPDYFCGGFVYSNNMR